MAKEAGNSERTAPGIPFEKGKSGNPNGRPKMPEALKKKIRDSVPASIDALIDIVQNGKDTDRIKAAEVLIERAYGKAVQAVEASINDVTKRIDTSKLTKDQLDVVAALAIQSMNMEDDNS